MQPTFDDPHRSDAARELYAAEARRLLLEAERIDRIEPITAMQARAKLPELDYDGSLDAAAGILLGIVAAAAIWVAAVAVLAILWN